ncbi:MAG: DUF934 domain-containing protein [Casimicrobiaceae bacterium]
MPQLIKGRALAADRWALLRESGAALPDGRAIVALAAWVAQRDALAARGDVGVWLAPADDPGALAGDIARLPLVAVDFPQFVDGRGYSTARLLRQRYGYTGELRAIGDIQRDQLSYLAQCGFDAFALRDGEDANGALAAFHDFADGYQITEARTPWFRRRVAMSRAVVE